MVRHLGYLFLFLSLLSCTGQTENKLSPKAFHDALDNETVQLIDVRTLEEYQEGHIKGALNIDYLGEHFSADINKLDKQKPVYVYCRSGNRSGKSTAVFEELGFKTIYDLYGGIVKWRSEGFKVVLD